MTGTTVPPAPSLLLVLLTSAGLLAACAAESPPADAAVTVPVVRVVDGDTIHIFRDGRDETVRLIGIDAPEVGWYGGVAECFGPRAGRFLIALLDGERVRLEGDLDPVDRYGRLLSYAYLADGRMVNLLMVREGLATVTIFAPNDRHEARLRAAEADARDRGEGLWSACASG